MEGGTKAAKEIADRIEGKPPQRMEITGPVRKDVTIRVVYDRIPVRDVSQTSALTKVNQQGLKLNSHD